MLNENDKLKHIVNIIDKAYYICYCINIYFNSFIVLQLEKENNCNKKVYSL